MFIEIHLDKIPKIPCVYKLTNLKNGKLYIGETINLKQRHDGYKRQIKQVDGSDIISRALRKYGFDGFKLEIIESYPYGTSKKVLVQREAFWIKFFSATNKKIGYNICNFGTNAKGIKFFGKRLSSFKSPNKGKKLSQEWKDKIGNANKGKKRTDEQRKKMSEDGMGRAGHPHDEETKKRISKSHTGKRKAYIAKSVNQIDAITGEILNTFYSMEDATFFLRGHRTNTSISLAANGKLKTAYGFKWRFIQDVI